MAQATRARCWNVGARFIASPLSVYCVHLSLKPAQWLGFCMSASAREQKGVLASSPTNWGLRPATPLHFHSPAVKFKCPYRNPCSRGGLTTVMRTCGFLRPPPAYSTKAVPNGTALNPTTCHDSSKQTFPYEVYATGILLALYTVQIGFE